MLPFIQAFGHSINMYWLSVIVGIVLAFALALLRAKSDCFRTSCKHTFFTMLFAVLGARVGAALFKLVGHIFLYATMPDFWTAENIFGILRSGGVFYGGLVGGFLAVLFYIHENKLDFRDVTDLLMPAIPLFHMFGRLGCFFAGCCYGRASTWGIAMPNGIMRIPVQLIEAGFCLVILAGMLLLRPERKRPGILLPTYLVFYSIGRFIIEFMRGDISRGVFLLSTSQWLSLLVLLMLVVILVVKRKREAVRKALAQTTVANSKTNDESFE